MDHPQGVLRTGDRATVQFEFISHPEFMKTGSKILFREGTTKVLRSGCNLPSPFISHQHFTGPRSGHETAVTDNCFSFVSTVSYFICGLRSNVTLVGTFRWCWV